MLTGYLLGSLAIIVLAVSVYSGKTSLIILSISGLAFILLAGVSGLSFMFSGFQNDLSSFLMALGFIGAISVCFMQFYFAKES